MALKLQGRKLSIQDYMLPFCFRQKFIKKVLHFSQLSHFFICSHILWNFPCMQRDRKWLNFTNDSSFYWSPSAFMYMHLFIRCSALIL